MAYTASQRRWVVAEFPLAAFEIPDEALLRAAARGDPRAFESLVGRYAQPLFNFLYRFLGNSDDAADVTQQVWLQFFSWLPRLDPGQSPRSWLFLVARNKAMDLLKARQAIPFSKLPDAEEEEPDAVSELPDTSPLPEALVERQDLQRLLHQAIQALPLRYRTVVALRYTTDLTFGEIAQALGLPENTAKTLFHRAKARLRTFLRQAL